MHVTRDRRGQSLVEFALILPIIMLLMIGVFDLGRVVFVNNSLSDGARDAARAATIDPRDAGLAAGEPTYCERVEESLRSAILDLELESLTVTYQVISPPDTVSSEAVLCDIDGATGASVPISAGPGDRVVVVAEADVDLATPLVSNAAGRGGFSLSAQSSMNVTFAPSTSTP